MHILHVCLNSQKTIGLGLTQKLMCDMLMKKSENGDRDMQNFSMNEIPYGIPAYGIYGGEGLWKADENKSKYFDLQKDIQVGLDLGSIEELEQEYLEEVCGGVLWDADES